MLWLFSRIPIVLAVFPAGRLFPPKTGIEAV
jgi:hypothetical protein